MIKINYSASSLTITSGRGRRISSPVNIPVPVYIQEAENLRHWCRADREKLTSAGLDWSVVESLPSLIDDLRQAQAVWNVSTDNIRLRERWKQMVTEARDLRFRLSRTMKFIFRKDPSSLASIRTFGEGRSHAAVIQSLNSLAVFGEQRIETLRAAGFDITELCRATDLAREMAALFAGVNRAKLSCDRNLRARDMAFSRLEEAVNEIKVHAKFVLWRDPHRLKGYSSEFRRRKNRRYRLKKREEKAMFMQDGVTSLPSLMTAAQGSETRTANQKTAAPKPETSRPKTGTIRIKVKKTTAVNKTNTTECETNAWDNSTEGKKTLTMRVKSGTGPLLH